MTAARATPAATAAAATAVRRAAFGLALVVGLVALAASPAAANSTQDDCALCRAVEPAMAALFDMQPDELPRDLTAHFCAQAAPYDQVVACMDFIGTYARPMLRRMSRGESDVCDSLWYYPFLLYGVRERLCDVPAAQPGAPSSDAAPRPAASETDAIAASAEPVSFTVFVRIVLEMHSVGHTLTSAEGSISRTDVVVQTDGSVVRQSENTHFVVGTNGDTVTVTERIYGDGAEIDMSTGDNLATPADHAAAAAAAATITTIEISDTGVWTSVVNLDDDGNVRSSQETTVVHGVAAVEQELLLRTQEGHVLQAANGVMHSTSRISYILTVSQQMWVCMSTGRDTTTLMIAGICVIAFVLLLLITLDTALEYFSDAGGHPYDAAPPAYSALPTAVLVSRDNDLEKGDVKRSWPDLGVAAPPPRLTVVIGIHPGSPAAASAPVC